MDAEDFECGFDCVFVEVVDLKIDFLDVVVECVMFLVCVVVDDVVSVTYLETACSRDGYGEGRDVVKLVKMMLVDVSGELCVCKVWGGFEGYSVDNVKIEMWDIIDEYLMSRDGVEAERRLRRLNMFFYYYEFVKKVLMLVIE